MDDEKKAALLASRSKFKTIKLFQDDYWGKSKKPGGFCNDWYFMTFDNKYVTREKIILEAYKQGVGFEIREKHIRKQLEMIGLIDEFDAGRTVLGCPFSLCETGW